MLTIFRFPRSEQPRRHMYVCQSADIHILGASALTSLSLAARFYFFSVAFVRWFLTSWFAFYLLLLALLVLCVLCTHFTFGFVVFSIASLSCRIILFFYLSLSLSLFSASYCEAKHHYINIYSIALALSWTLWLFFSLVQYTWKCFFCAFRYTSLISVSLYAFLTYLRPHLIDFNYLKCRSNRVRYYC